jgi:fumarate reductase flavoprotein subunit
VELLTRETGNPLTVGARFDPRQLVDALAKDVRFGETTDEPTILATGGFPVRLASERGLLLRANPWSEGDGLDLARSRGAETAGDLDEFYGRAMPAVEDVPEEDFVRLSQLYGRYARVTAHDMSERFEGPPDWSETDLAQAIARWPDGLAWFSVDRADLDTQVRDRTVGEMIEAARAAGAPVENDDGRIAVLVRAAVTQTLGGVQVDEHARAAEGLYVAGADVGGISTGGWSSGLATALVLGLVAAESALD